MLKRKSTIIFLSSQHQISQASRLDIFSTCPPGWTVKMNIKIASLVIINILCLFAIVSERTSRLKINMIF